MDRAPGSLFDWQERRRIQAMELQREHLRARIADLRPRSFKRVELQARLRDLTEQELRLQTQLDQDNV
jgi:hypothetical protein